MPVPLSTSAFYTLRVLHAHDFAKLWHHHNCLPSHTERRARAGEDPGVMSFKIIDFGHARLLGDKRGASLPGSPQMEKWYRRCRQRP